MRWMRKRVQSGWCGVAGAGRMVGSMLFMDESVLAHACLGYSAHTQ